MLKSPLFWKITTLAGCICLLLIPLMMVGNLIKERSDTVMRSPIRYGKVVPGRKS